ncbi:acyltransferase [Microbacterium sp. 2FI]|uniref:acyltransferase family protein n=1 Tax=Microbacterium sp. 2FI TaxID=2502193 RepID=UPI0010F9A478|nr:acyltransferase [Microbacterium sp. 2FI]
MPGPARLHTLDYTRGLAATVIMVHHYLSWWNGTPPDATTPLGRIGVYGVALFYVLSGLTMFHVYNDSTRTVRDVGRFFTRRLFRIMPLLWIVTALSLVIVPREINPGDLVLNLTGLFGFVAWDTYFSAGVWSIGNELVFYAIFPLLVGAAMISRWALAGLGAALLTAYVLIAYFYLSPWLPMDYQWAMYVNPANQAFLFFGGFAIGYLLRAVTVRQREAVLLIAVGVAVLLLWPTGFAVPSLVTGTNRIVLTVACLLICAGAYKLTLRLPAVVDRPLTLLGEASYSIYLIHPLVFFASLSTVATDWPVGVKIPAAIAATLLLSWACYRFFEAPLTRLGRRLTPRPTEKRPVPTR